MNPPAHVVGGFLLQHGFKDSSAESPAVLPIKPPRY